MGGPHLQRFWSVEAFLDDPAALGCLPQMVFWLGKAMLLDVGFLMFLERLGRKDIQNEIQYLLNLQAKAFHGEFAAGPGQADLNARRGCQITQTYTGR